MLNTYNCPAKCHVCFYLLDINKKCISEMFWALDSNEVSIYPAGASMWANDEYWEGA